MFFLYCGYYSFQQDISFNKEHISYFFSYFSVAKKYLIIISIVGAILLE